MKALKNTTAYMVASLLPSAANLFMMPVYTHHLAPEEFGLVSVVVTIKTFLAAFMGLQIVNSITRLYFDYEGRELKEYISTIYFAALGFNLLVLGGFHFFGDGLTRLLFPKVSVAYSPYVMLVLISLFFTTQVNFGNALLRVLERGGAVLLGGLSYTLCSAAFGVYFVVWRGWGAAGMLAAQAATNFVHGAVLLFLVRSQIQFCWNGRLLKGALRFSIPLIPHSLGGILFMYTDKYVLSFFVPLASIGLYELACRLANILRILVASFNGAITPDFMRMSKKDQEEATRVYGMIMLRWSSCLALCFLGVSLFSAELIALLAPPKYTGAHVFVPILLAAFILRALQGFAVNAILFVKKVRVIPVMTFSSGLLNLGLNLLLIPHYGVIAAAWTTLLSYLCTFLFSLYFSRKYYPMEFHWRRLGLLFAVMFLCFACGWLIPVGGLLLTLVWKAAICLVFAGWVWLVDFAGIRAEVFRVIDGLRPLFRSK